MKWVSISWPTDGFVRRYSDCAHSSIGICALANSLMLRCGYSILHDEIIIMDKRARFFLLVKWQPSIDHHVTRIRPLICIERSIKLITLHFHLPVKFITYFICSLINCTVSQVVVGGPHTIS